MQNIYDLEGNYYEWTAEAYSTYSRVGRGGGYDDVSGGNFNPASYRYSGDPTRTLSFTSSRSALYVAL